MFMPRPTEGMSLEKKVDLLMSEREIRDVLYRDCRADWIVRNHDG